MDCKGEYSTGILIGEASEPKKANKISRFFENCPYKVFDQVKGNNLFIVFSLPKDHEWWLLEIKENPETTIGLLKADVFFSDQFNIQSPFEKDEIEPTLEKSPCDTDCSKCHFYKKRCEGCPATVFYLKGRK